MKRRMLERRMYHVLNITIQQENDAKLPYYGPIARGWLGHALSKDPVLRRYFFKNRDLDVRPYFLWTDHSGSRVTIHLSMLGNIPREGIEAILNAISEMDVGHLGGINAEIERISMVSRYFRIPEIDDYVSLNFVSPTAVMREGRPAHHPSLGEVIKALLRSANR